MLRVTKATVDLQLGQAHTLACYYPQLLEAPNRIWPIAERLAEQYSERTIDERYAAASNERHVWVCDRGNRMSDLCAYLPHDNFKVLV